MTFAALIEQLFNGLQFGLMLFLMAVGVTLVFGIMRVINLAHGSLFMLGGYFFMAALTWSHSYLFAIPLAFMAAALVAIVIESSCCGRSTDAACSTRCLRRSA